MPWPKTHTDTQVGSLQPCAPPEGVVPDEPEQTLVGALRRQVLRPRTSLPIAIAVAALVLGLRSLLGISPAAIWTELTSANLPLLLLAVAVFYLTFPVRALRWRVLLRNAGQSRLPSLRQLTRMMVLGAFANSVSVAQLGDVYRAYLLKKETAASLPMTLGTILAERLLDLVTLIGLLAAAALTVYAGHLPSAAVDALVGGAGVSVAGMLALAALPSCQSTIKRRLPERWRAAYAGFEQGAVRSLRQTPVLAAYSALAWLIEGATLWLLGLAIGVSLPPTGALVAGLVASLLSVEPITPGGLGVTEPGIVLVLSSLGVAATGASAIALLNRLVNYLSLVFAGAIVLCFRRCQMTPAPLAPPRVSDGDVDAKLGIAATTDWLSVMRRCAWCHPRMDEHGHSTDVARLDASAVVTDGSCPRSSADALVEIAAPLHRSDAVAA